MNLPLSQLVLGRTGPPWHAEAWRRLPRSCTVEESVDRAHVLRLAFPAGCSFSATPRGFPTTDATLRYSIKFDRDFAWGSWGMLPGLRMTSGKRCPATCGAMWLNDGRVVAFVHATHRLPAGCDYANSKLFDACPQGCIQGAFFGRACLQFRVARGAWNHVVLRVKLNSFDETGAPRPDGSITLAVNGKAATADGVVWRTGATSLIRGLHVDASAARDCRGAAEFTDFYLVT